MWSKITCRKNPTKNVLSGKEIKYNSGETVELPPLFFIKTWDILYNFWTKFPAVFIKARRPKLVFPPPAADGRMALAPLLPPPWTECGRGGERVAACWSRRPPSGCAPPPCCSRAGSGPLQSSRYQICMMDNRHQISGRIIFFKRLVVQIRSLKAAGFAIL
jgi:hypothetical protein